MTCSILQIEIQLYCAVKTLVINSESGRVSSSDSTGIMVRYALWSNTNVRWSTELTTTPNVGPSIRDEQTPAFDEQFTVSGRRWRSAETDEQVDLRRNNERVSGPSAECLS